MFCGVLDVFGSFFECFCDFQDLFLVFDCSLLCFLFSGPVLGSGRFSPCCVCSFLAFGLGLGSLVRALSGPRPASVLDDDVTLSEKVSANSQVVATTSGACMRGQKTRGMPLGHWGHLQGQGRASSVSWHRWSLPAVRRTSASRVKGKTKIGLSMLARPGSIGPVSRHMCRSRKKVQPCVWSAFLCVVEVFGGYAGSCDLHRVHVGPQSIPE